MSLDYMAEWDDFDNRDLEYVIKEAADEAVRYAISQGRKGMIDFLEELGVCAEDCK